MSKKRNNQKELLWLGITLIIIVGLYFLVSSGNTRIVVKQYDEDGNLVSEESLKTAFGFDQTQSFFNPELDESSFFLLAAKGVEEDEPTTASFEIATTNPFDHESKLLTATILKNEQKIFAQPLSITMMPGETFIYKTPEIELLGKDAQLNVITVHMLYQDADNAQITQVFQYGYYSLTKCTKQEDCKYPNNYCDLEDVAGFGYKGETYCVKPCLSNQDCYEGQVCHSGRCGY